MAIESAVDTLSNPAVSGGLGAALMWCINRLFTFLIDWKKANKDQEVMMVPNHDQCYKPHEEWKNYCIMKFEASESNDTKILMKIEMLENRLNDFRIDHRDCSKT